MTKEHPTPEIVPGFNDVEMADPKDFTNVEMKAELTNRCTHGRCKFCSPLYRPIVAEADAESFLKSFEKNVEIY